MYNNSDFAIINNPDWLSTEIISLNHPFALFSPYRTTKGDAKQIEFEEAIEKGAPIIKIKDFYIYLRLRTTLNKATLSQEELQELMQEAADFYYDAVAIPKAHVFRKSAEDFDKVKKLHRERKAAKRKALQEAEYEKIRAELFGQENDE